jgi:TRAP transporter TAXI family solute receptor
VRRLTLLLVVLTLALAACVTQDQVEPVASDPAGEQTAAEAPEPASEPEGEGEDAGGGRLTIATGGTGGVYFVYGGGLANEITQNLEGYEATAQVTSASVDNAFLIADGGADVAFALADTAADAVNGEDVFEEPLELRALANIYRNVNHLVTTAGTGIATVGDLRGRAVSVGSPGSGTEVTALRVLEVAGLNPDADIRREQLGVAESVQALRDGTIEAFFWSGGLPTAAVSDLASTDQLVLVPLEEQLAGLVETYGEVYQEITVPADTYAGLAGDVVTIGVANYLVVNAEMDEQLAYDLTALLFERQEALTQVHPEAGNLDLATATEVDPLELHPGAQRYYDEAR